jgi:hypothetical protein
MRFPRYCIRTLMVAVALAAVASWAAIRIYEWLAEPDMFGGIKVVALILMAPPALFLTTCAFLLVRYRNL